MSWDEQPSPSSRRPRKGWDQVRRRVLRRDGHECQIRGPQCLVAATEVDHIVNVASGGTDDPENLRAACRPCNRAKAQAEAAAARRARSAGGRHPTERHPGLL